MMLNSQSQYPNPNDIIVLGVPASSTAISPKLNGRNAKHVAKMLNTKDAFKFLYKNVQSTNTIGLANQA